jgi:hypothetical protein
MNHEIIPITERGTLTLPSAFRKKLGISGRQQLIGEVNNLGEIVLRPAAIFALEVYNEERIKEFFEQDNELGQALIPKT